ncbi:MAG: hypothetical protein WBB39_02100 [Candidatus Saccharimonadales bacterium]
MTAWQPDPDKPTAWEDLGGRPHELTGDSAQALRRQGLNGRDVLRVASREDTRDAYAAEGVAPGFMAGVTPERAAQLRADFEAARASHASAPQPPSGKTPEQIMKEANVSWDAIESLQGNDF